ncbi:hypothetical protein LSH36_1379g00020 [Paralvinella palmiformis]|uniref:Uncharacterized protein n=1 Tax=Paralvinella palmiformis TaxID=53620 RepID=A0AAD9MQT6_9ANNE|nr:hypothetical protein LSH36_1379g00020 [Paralvinella palmiformis]
MQDDKIQWMTPPSWFLRSARFIMLIGLCLMVMFYIWIMMTPDRVQSISQGDFVKMLSECRQLNVAQVTNNRTLINLYNICQKLLRRATMATSLQP